MSGNAQAALRWVEKAEEDLALAHWALKADKPLTSGACFHSQQGAEKYLKALLVHVETPFPPTHDLADLLRLLMERFPQAAPLREKADMLTEYAVEVRYPDMSRAPDVAEARAALAAAEKIKQFCTTRIE